MPAKAKKTKPPMRRVMLNHGGKQIAVPQLSEPVGPDTPALRAKYPRLNQPADVAIVDFYLSQLEAVHDLAGRGAIPGSRPVKLLTVLNAVNNWSDRSAAIAALQGTFAVRDADEVRDGLIKPNGRTLIELVDNGDAAEKLLTLGLGPNSQRDPAEYVYRGRFDHDVFQSECARLFLKVPKYSPASLPQLVTFLSFMEDDHSIYDIRWMAYMLATAFVETSKLVTTAASGNRKKQRAWSNFSPVEETGKGSGRDYYLPVKIARLPDGSARVTEQDGDQFTVSPAGKRAPIGLVQGRGAASNTVAAPIYNTDSGTPNQYYGRGFVQLTWWDNYVDAGVLLGRGLEFLFSPDRVLDPRTAYLLMSYCMRTGAGFANGRHFAQYFFGHITDYLGARDMVNARGDHQEVAQAAERFEAALLAAKPKTFAP